MADLIMHSQLLLVEGEDESNFIKAILSRLQLHEKIGIEVVGGKDKFKQMIPALVARTGFRSKVKVLGIIRDSDTNRQAAFQSIQTILKNNNLPAPKNDGEFMIVDNLSVGVYLMPFSSENGMLEDLCLKTVSNHPAMDCVEGFIQCVATLDIDQPKNLAKAKSHVFLAAMPEIVSSVGVAALKGYWNLAHDSMSELNDFLLKFE